MGKSLFFYVIDEFTSVKSYCKRKGLAPYRYKMGMMDNLPLEVETQYTKNGFVYDILECDKIHSDYMITLMRLPKLSFEELLKLSLNTRHLDERAGAIGLILKEHSKQFDEFLLKLSEKKTYTLSERKSVKRMTSFVVHLLKNNAAWNLEKTLLLCEKVLSICNSKKTKLRN